MVSAQHGEAALNSLLGASLHILANMVSVQPSGASPEDIDVVITFRSSSQDPIYVSADATNWQPEAMDYNGEAYEHVITVPRGTRSIHYKFRIGDSMWVHDAAISAEPDGFGGFNNRFDIPEVPYPSQLVDFDEDTELESIAAVESVADTVSSADAEEEKLNGFHHDEPEFIDVEDVISDPDYPGFSDSPSSGSSLRQLLGFGLRSRF